MSDDTNPLREALSSVRQSVKNARGAIESNQVVDKDVHGTLTRIIAAIDAVLSAPAPQHSVMVEDEIARVVQSVNEWDDRTSPDDYPEHLLITSEELTDILHNFAATLEGRDNG